MKICVLGLDSATPALTFEDERLVNIRRLMELGVYGELQEVIPPGPMSGWALAASQDPASLRIDSLHDHSHDLAARSSVNGPFLWDQVAAAGKQALLTGLPPILAPQPDHSTGLIWLPLPDAGAAGSTPEELRDHIFDTSRQHWDTARHLLREQQWDYLHFVDVNLDRLQRAFWANFEPHHPRYQPGNPYHSVIPDYYLWLDEQIGSVLELLDTETALLLVSTNGMQPLAGNPANAETKETNAPGGHGLFILTAPNCPLSGLYEGASVLDMAPTLLDLAGYEIPPSMQGRSLVKGMEKKRQDAGSDSEQIIMDRLAGLGYV
jgi:predicted AlkP superfamily phosphohydrolase/phosphomutase